MHADHPNSAAKPHANFRSLTLKIGIHGLLVAINTPFSRDGVFRLFIFSRLSGILSCLGGSDRCPSRTPNRRADKTKDQSRTPAFCLSVIRMSPLNCILPVRKHLFQASSLEKSAARVRGSDFLVFRKLYP